MIDTKNNRRRVVGYVGGTGGVFGRAPFFQIQLSKQAVRQLDELLMKADGDRRCTLTVTASFQQPDRLRVTEADPPQYEAVASSAYVRGDAMRVNGREGASCGIDLSARWGVPALRNALRLACERANNYVLLRIPSRKRDLVEIIPDMELLPADEGAVLSASATSAAALLPAEDFSDWETH
jgi:hypothetical protein